MNAKTKRAAARGRLSLCVVDVCESSRNRSFMGLVIERARAGGRGCKAYFRFFFCNVDRFRKVCVGNGDCGAAACINIAIFRKMTRKLLEALSSIY